MFLTGFVSVNDLHRTGRSTFAAAGTFFVVDRSVEVLDFDCTVRTFLLAHFTADTAAFAGSFCILAVVAGRAENISSLALRLDAYERIRTYSSALSASSTESRDDLSQAVFYLYSVVFTDSSAVAETYTAVLAETVSAVESLNSLAGLYAVKLKLCLSSIAVAGAVYNSGHRYDLSGGSTEYFGYFSGSISASRTAEVSSSALCNDSVGVVGTACKSAGTAVSLRESRTDLFDAFIHLYVEYL